MDGLGMRIVIMAGGIIFLLLLVNLFRILWWIKRNEKQSQTVQDPEKREPVTREKLPPDWRGDAAVSCCLLRKKDGTVIRLEGGCLVIGKSGEQADYVIADNKAVSRRHAGIFYKEGRYCIRDFNSANGTYVNGKRVRDDAVPLANQDKIVLADEIFEFKEEM